MHLYCRTGAGRRRAHFQPVRPALLWCHPKDYCARALEVLELCSENMVKAALPIILLV